MRFGSGTERFWIVVSVARGMADTPHRHTTEESAFAEAERLARGNGLDRFLVFEAKGVSKRVEVVTTKFGANDDIPF